MIPRSAVLEIAPEYSGFRRMLEEQLRKEAELVDEACLRMLYGNRGALLGVVVQRHSDLRLAVRLVDPDDEPAATAGEITYLWPHPASEIAQATRELAKVTRMPECVWNDTPSRFGYTRDACPQLCLLAGGGHSSFDRCS